MESAVCVATTPLDTPNPLPSCAPPQWEESFMENNNSSNNQEKQRSRRLLVGATILAAVAAVAITALLVNIFERKQEAKNLFYRVVELNDTIDDPATWGKNFPFQYDGYKKTTDQERTKYG